MAEVLDASVSEADLRAAFSGPAISSNKIFVTRTVGGIRIAFTEQYVATYAPEFRTAVMLSFEDAMQLRDLLINQLLLLNPIENMKEGG
jgi:hypothetical protein